MRTVFRVEPAKQVIEVNPFWRFHPHASQEHTTQFAVRKAQQRAFQNPRRQIRYFQSFVQLRRIRFRPRHIVDVAVRLQKELLVQKQVAHKRCFGIVQADKALLEKRCQRLLNFALHRLRHGGDFFALIQKMSNDPVKVLALGAENLHLREHLDKSFKTFEFHGYKCRIYIH